MYLGQLKIHDIFVYSTKFNKLTENGHQSIYEFLEYIKKDDSIRANMKDFILLNLANVYTLSSVYTIEYNDEWKDRLNKKQYSLYNENDEYILGYMIINPDISGKGIDFIEYIDTRITHNNLAMFMIQKYGDMFLDKQSSVTCLPHNIDMYSSGFWKKYFERECYMNSIESVYDLIKSHGIRSVINWNPLFDLYIMYSKKR
jgi:hypothetical protein